MNNEASLCYEILNVQTKRASTRVQALWSIMCAALGVVRDAIVSDKDLAYFDKMEHITGAYLNPCELTLAPCARLPRDVYVFRCATVCTHHCFQSHVVPPLQFVWALVCTQIFYFGRSWFTTRLKHTSPAACCQLSGF